MLGYIYKIIENRGDITYIYIGSTLHIQNREATHRHYFKNKTAKNLTIYNFLII
jgi:predicted GIY-YIG superfamily endonuclease